MVIPIVSQIVINSVHFKCDFSKDIPVKTHIGGEDDELTLGDTLADDTPSAESILVDKELLDALYDELNRLDPEGKRICELLMYHSEREAADIMGMARSTFKRHWAKIQAELQDTLIFHAIYHKRILLAFVFNISFICKSRNRNNVKSA